MSKHDKSSEYAESGVDYAKIGSFKQIMQEFGEKTLNFPNRREVFVDSSGVFQYRGTQNPLWKHVSEGLGNKNRIAEWMYQYAETGRSYYKGIGIDTAMMAVVDVLRFGALPVVYTNEVAAGDSDWFNDNLRAGELARGYYEACKMAGMALIGGESSSLRYLIKGAPVLSGSIDGIVVPSHRLITGEELQPGDLILGVSSSGLHANGASLVIRKAMELPDKFLTKLPNGNTLGEEALIPTRCYVSLVEALLREGINIHAFVPGTGGGVSKIAYNSRNLTYIIFNWPEEISPLMQFMREEMKVPLEDCLTTFNWGIGYYIFAPQKEVSKIMEIGENTGYQIYELGKVEAGERKVIFQPEDIPLPPPGE